MIEQNRLLAEIARTGDPSTPVPTCPRWTLRQLVAHVGRGDRWAAIMIRERSTSPLDIRTVPDGKPADGDAVEWLQAGARMLIDAVGTAGPDAPVWTFTGPKPAAWWIRRRLHESTVHRADAAHAVGVDYALEPELAADGVSEYLDLVAVRPAAAGPAPLDPGVTLHLHATDDGLGTAGEWVVRGGDAGVGWEHGHVKATTAVRGSATDLLLGLLRREPIAVEILGDDRVWTTWHERTAF